MPTEIIAKAITDIALVKVSSAKTKTTHGGIADTILTAKMRKTTSEKYLFRLNPISLCTIITLMHCATHSIIKCVTKTDVAGIPSRKRIYEIGRIENIAIPTAVSYFLIFPVALADIVMGFPRVHIKVVRSVRRVKITVLSGTSTSHNSSTFGVSSSNGKVSIYST